MGIRDRDYMRNQPDDEAYRKYEEESQTAEYGDLAKRKTGARRLVIVFVAVMLLAFLIALLVSGF